SGSRFEPHGLGGISHFHEHMLHRGTTAHPTAHALALAFEELGSELGAATYVDHTTIGAGAPLENLDRVIGLLGELVQNPVWSAIETERAIVREEILESLNERGESVDADEALIALAFPQHGLGRPIAGTIQALDRFDEPALSRFHAAHYHGGGLVVSVAGPLDANAVAATLESAFGGLANGAPPEDAPPKSLAGPCFRYVSDSGTQTALRVAFRAPAEVDKLEPATELLLRTLDDGMSTRLYHQVCDERGLAYDVSASYEAFHDAGLFTIAGESAHGSAERLLRAFFEVVSDLRENGPNDAELEKAQRRFAWQMRSVLDDPGELAAFLGLGELTGTVLTPASRQKELADVSSDLVREAARRVFQPSELAVVAVGDLTTTQRRALERALKSFGA
ncbi:MAG TPA: pitrilysin family protein, partial [Polyangiaceae bacterium]|nr:pitrilysin family protein [Polyangiaceae bacterium]